MPRTDARAAQRSRTRDLRAGERDIDRELRQLERQEAKLMLDVKAAGKRGDASSAKLLAKHVVSLRTQKERMMKARGRIKGVAAQTSAMSSMATTANAMGTATKAMTSANKAMQPQKLQGVMSKFAEESARMEVADEMMNDTLDAALDDSDVDEESDQVLNQVLEEMALKTRDEAARVPTRRMPARATAAATQGDPEEEELLRRLAALQ